MACRLCGYEGTAISVRVEDLTVVKRISCAKCGLLLETTYEPYIPTDYRNSVSCGCGVKA